MLPTGSPSTSPVISTSTVAPIRRSTSTNAMRVGLHATPSTTTSESGVTAAPTSQNAADDGSPGIAASNACGAPDRTRIVVASTRSMRRAERGQHPLGVVAARVRLGDLGDAARLQAGEHERGLHLRARDRRARARSRRSAPPSTVSGGNAPSSGPSMCAPIARNGSTIRRMGRRRSDSSPDSVVRNGRPATSPVRVRIDVPELPQSTTSADSTSASTPRPSTVIAGAGDGDRHAQAARARAACGRRRRRRPARSRASARRPSPRTGARGARCPCRRGPAGVRAAARLPRSSSSGPSRERCPRRVVAVLVQRGLERVGAAFADHEHEHTAATFERVRDLEVGDVDAEARWRACATSAITPSRSGTGIRNSNSCSSTGRPTGRLRRATRAVSSRSSSSVAVTARDHRAHARRARRGTRRAR